MLKFGNTQPPADATPEMTEIHALRSVVQTAIDEGRLGVLKFVRSIATVTEAGELEDAVASLTSLAEAWFASAPTRRYRMDSALHVYITEMVSWGEGQGAVVTATVAPGSAPTLDLIVVGSRGTLYFEE